MVGDGEGGQAVCDEYDGLALGPQAGEQLQGFGFERCIHGGRGLV